MSRQRTMEAILASEYVTIGELVRLTECRYSTLKFYTEEGKKYFSGNLYVPEDLEKIEL